jgi:hypothetical protein
MFICIFKKNIPQSARVPFTAISISYAKAANCFTCQFPGRLITWIIKRISITIARVGNASAFMTCRILMYNFPCRMTRVSSNLRKAMYFSPEFAQTALM